MQELITSFGINGYLLVAQIVNFLIIFWLLKKFAFKPILAVLEKRKETILQTQKNAENAENALAQASEKEQEILSAAQKEAKHLIENATAQASILIEKANAAGKHQVEKMLIDAKTQLEKDRKDTEKELVKHVAILAVTMLKASLKDLLDEKDAEKILTKAAKTIK